MHNGLLSNYSLVVVVAINFDCDHFYSSFTRLKFEVVKIHNRLAWQEFSNNSTFNIT